MVRYEWIVEDLDNVSDIQDVTHFDSRKDAERFVAENTPIHAFEIGLVRDTWEEDGNLKDRQWAYLVDGTLPDTFDGGASIPRRFRNAKEAQ